MPFDRGNRTYHVSDERLRAFRALSAEEKLRWVEELAAFLRLALPVESAASSKAKKHSLRSLAIRDVPLWIDLPLFPCPFDTSK